MEIQFVRPPQMAKMLGVSPRTLSNWTAMKVIPFRKIQRVILFDPAEVKEALDRFETKVDQRR
jgi:hypothetical protein